MEDEAELVALRRRVRELEALESVARAAREPMELDEAMAALVESAAASLHAEVCALEVASTRGARGEIAYRSSQERADATRSSASSPRSRRTSRTGGSSVPLPTRRGAHGALVAWRSRPGPWSAREQELAEAAAAHAATVLAGARGAMRGLFAREVHHRVKNNLQTVASLLRLAASGDVDPKRALRDSIGRVLAIAEVHDLLTARRDEDVDSADLVRRLCGMLRGTLDGTLETGPLAPDHPRARARDGARARALRARRQCDRARRRARVRRAPARRGVRRAHRQRPRPGPATADRDARAGTLDRARARRGRSRRHACASQQADGVRATVRFPFVR